MALGRKNYLFAGSDQGGVHWGVIASLIETAKLNAVDPQADLASTLFRLATVTPPAGSTTSCRRPTTTACPVNSAYRSP